MKEKTPRYYFDLVYKIYRRAQISEYSNLKFKSLLRYLILATDDFGVTRSWIGASALDWPDFNFTDAVKIINDNQDLSSENKEILINSFPKGIKETQREINKMRKHSQKFPSKPYKLKEDTQNLFSMIPRQIYYAGIHWLQFNYEKGLDALIEKDKTGYYIYDAGIYWKQFDYEKGLDALIEKDKTGNYIYLAGIDWPQFNYEKGFNALKKFPFYYELALKDWPKGIKETQKVIDELKKRSKKFPEKKLHLENLDKLYDSLVNLTD